AAKGVAGSQAGDDVDRNDVHSGALVRRRDEHSFVAELHDCQLDAALEKRVRRLLGVGRAKGDLAFAAVADGDGCVGDRRAELVGPDRGHDRAPAAQPGCGDRDVRGAAADRLGERLDVSQRYTELLRIQIDADSADRQQLELAHAWMTPSISWVSASSSAPPAILRSRCSRVTTAFAWSPITRQRFSITTRSL